MGFSSRLALFCLTLSLPRMTRKTTLSHSRPLGPYGTCLVYKTLLCINLSHLASHLLHFFNKKCFINMNIQEITIKSITLNQTTF